jgi:hypothetical protein
MDNEEARQKEAERTLQRIKGTLNHLEDGSAWHDPFTVNQEFQRMKKLVESGYSHNQPGFLKRLNSLIRGSATMVLLIIAILLMIQLLQR